MKFNSRWMGVAVALAWLLAPSPGAPAQMMGRPQYAYDLDSLVYTSSDVVEGTFVGGGAVSGPGQPRAASINVEITTVHKGSLKPGQIIPVACPQVYHKRADDGAETDLEYGEQLILLLAHGATALDSPFPPQMGNVPQPRVASHADDPYTVSPQRIKIVQDGQVKGLTLQSRGMSAPGPGMAPPPPPGMLQRLGPGMISAQSPGMIYRLEQPADSGEKEFPTVKEFGVRLDEAVRKGSALDEHLKAPDVLKEMPWFTGFLRDRAQQSRLQRMDYLGQLVLMRMILVRDLDALAPLLELRLPGQWNLSIQAHFRSTEGREYLFKKLEDDQIPAEKKVHYARAVFIPVRAGEVADFSIVERMARLALRYQKEEQFSLVLVSGVYAGVSGITPVAEDDLPPELKSAFTSLGAVYAASTSEDMKYRLELTMASLCPSRYQALGSKCGPVISLLRQLSPSRPGPDNRNGTLNYSCEWTPHGPVSVDLAFILLENLQTHQTWVLPIAQPAQFERPWSGNFAGPAPLPDDLVHGKYRVNLELLKDGKVISLGHGFDAEL